jgi:hypothetical protein
VSAEIIDAFSVRRLWRIIYMTLAAIETLHSATAAPMAQPLCIDLTDSNRPKAAFGLQPPPLSNADLAAYGSSRWMSLSYSY